jgi:plastocyanin
VGLDVAVRLHPRPDSLRRRDIPGTSGREGGAQVRAATRLIPAIPLIAGLLLTTGGAVIAATPVTPVTPTFTITADRASAIPTGHKWSFNDFFPRSATIAQGGTVQFTTEGFHTATLLPLSWTSAADNQVSGIVAADLDDATLNKNGTTRTLENVQNVLPLPPEGCGTADHPCTFDGTSIVSMGAPLAGPPAPFLVTITAAPGTYAFHCRIHQGMVGTLTVVPADSKVATTTAASAETAATAQAAEDVTAGMAAETAADKAAVKTNKDGTRTWTIAVGTSDPNGYVAVLDMLPRKLDVKPGDTVVWKALDRNEPHTVTFPGDIRTADIPSCEGAGGKDTPAVPTVVPPTSPFDFACNGHPADEIEFGGGNGVKAVSTPKSVSDSGVVAYSTVLAGFSVPASGALSSWSVKFAGAKKGTYTYVCQIHDGMNGTVVVH